MTSSTSRSAFPVLVTEAETLGAVAVVRSLGRAGYPVIAVSPQAGGLGLHSRWAAAAIISPGYERPGYLDWLDGVLAEHRIKAIIPSEAFLVAIKKDYAKYSKLLPFPKDPDKTFAGLSKADLFSHTPQEHLPPHFLVDEQGSPEQDAAKLRGLPTPIFIKLDSSYSKTRAFGKVCKADTVEAAAECIAQARKDFRKFLIQGYVPGKGVGAFFIVWDGKIIAEFMHLRLHEVPHGGGVSSLRSSFKHPEILEDARRRILGFGWRGPAMLEYRWDEKTGRFFLIEMNGRFWGSLHLALYSGIDFPTILLDAFRGDVVTPMLDYPDGIVCRDVIPRDLQHAWSLCTDPAVPRGAKLKAILDFIGHTLDPRIYSDLFSFPGDRRLFFVALRQYWAALKDRPRRPRG
jgi:predicted ATP-grasp superfamily ATP-dependent carboligase